MPSKSAITSGPWPVAIQQPEFQFDFHHGALRDSGSYCQMTLPVFGNNFQRPTLQIDDTEAEMAAKKTGRKWSAAVTEHSDALVAGFVDQHMMAKLIA